MPRLRIPARALIAMHANMGVAFDSLQLETTTGGIDAGLAQGVIIKGDVIIRTTTGGINFAWNNVKAANNVQVDVRTTTGGIDMNATQVSKLPANVTLNAEATTGGIVFALSISDGIAARIQLARLLALDLRNDSGERARRALVSEITTDKIGFSGNKSLLQSDYYPSSSNFIVGLRTTIGGIYVNATYSP